MKSQMRFVVFGIAVCIILVSAEEARTEQQSTLSDILTGSCEADSSRKELCSACPLTNCCTSQLTAEVCFVCAQHPDDCSDSIDDGDDSIDESDDADAVEKRARRLIGKRARRLIGKRARKLIGKRARKLIG